MIEQARLLTVVSLAGVLAVAVTASAAPTGETTRAAASTGGRTTPAAKPPGADVRVARAETKPADRELPQFVSIETLKKIRPRPADVVPMLEPMMGGRPLPPEMPAIPGVSPVLMPEDQPRAAKTSPAKSKAGAAKSSRARSATGKSRVASSAKAQTSFVASARGKVDPATLTRLAQAFPPEMPPAQVPGTGNGKAPHWVRFPLEFQLCGIGLGIHAVDKDEYNRIDRYGLFAIHGNPTAIVVPTSAGNSSTTFQQPPEVTTLFGNNGDELPDWASAITVALDGNHVEWLYLRGDYAMGFVVDRLGFVDAVVVAGVRSNIARTQMEDRMHTIKLGDDLRKVLYRYGYPDAIEVYGVLATAGATTAGVGGDGGGAAAAGGAGAGAAPAGGGAAPGGGGAGGGGNGGAGIGQGQGASAQTNSGYRTLELRYEQSYNVVFTIRNNRVVRIYIFGDPDFFNAQRRQQLRTGY